MKNTRIMTFILSLSMSLYMTAQDTITVQHTFYTTTFDREKHIPYLVQYTLRKNMLTCATHEVRKNKFVKDPQLPEATNLQKDYNGSGYDRGHNMSAQDNECSAIGMQECFYFSNMFPQPHAINAGIWENLERHERELAMDNDSVHIFICSIGEATTIGPDKVWVPEYDCKVIYVYNTGQYEVYKIPNTTVPKDAKYTDYTISLQELFKETGINYFSKL